MMPIPSQFQLGLELTNIVNPISQAVSTLGSLALVDAIKKSGSDSLTEMRMASLLGRHRIDPIIEVHFREMVAKSDQSVISRYMDIVLECGAGPTVQEALKNPALFSMVIQLSALAFAHQDEALTGAIVEATDRIAQESSSKSGIMPDYVSLLGTIRACQQQTVAFRWLPLYEAVERKINDSLLASVSDLRVTEGPAKRRKVDHRLRESVNKRCLPFSALQALLMWLHSLQSLPRNRFLHLKCDSGISTIVVWCYHVLGLNMTVKLQGVEFRFGDDPGNILVEESMDEESEATIMDPVDQCQPFFSMASEPGGSPHMASESRVEAFGYGRKILEQAEMCEEDVQYCSYWIIAKSVAAASECPVRSPSGRIMVPLPPKNRILSAGRFFFGLDQLNLDTVESYVGKSPNRKKFMKRPKCWALVAMVIVFARIQEQDLELCKALPLSLSVFRFFRRSDNDFKRLANTEDGIESFDSLKSFEIFSQLLVGSQSSHYALPAALVSAWGWSVFFDCMDAADPGDIPTSTFRVMCGVPTRGGLRRSRIIDGPNMGRAASLKREMISKDPPINFCPGISTAKRTAVSIGNSSDAFQVTLTFEWTSETLGTKKCRIGFREMQELCVLAYRLPPCQCDASTSDVVGWIGEQALYAPDRVTTFGPSGKDLFYEIRYPSNVSSATQRSERVYTKNIPQRVVQVKKDESEGSDIRAYRTALWIFHVSENPAARWLQLDAICKSYDTEEFNKVLRGCDTCFECSTSSNLVLGERPTLLLT